MSIHPFQIDSISRRRPIGRLALAVIACVAASAPAQSADPEPSGNLQVTTTKTVESFVPARTVPIASLELQQEVAVDRGDVTLRQLCKWPEADAELVAEFADLIVARIPAGTAFLTVSVEQIQAILRDAGMNPASVNFAGAATCRVTRSDVQVDEAEALRDWMTNSQGDLVIADANGTAAPSAADPAAPAEAKGDLQPPPDKMLADTADLRARLIADLATRLELSPDTMQVDFAPEDRKTLALAKPLEFRIEPQRATDLGNVSWLVTITNGTDSKRVRIAAQARAWIDQVVSVRPLTLRQTISESDIETRRILADRMPSDVLVTKEQIIGQQAAKDLKVGSVMTAKLLAPVELVRPGQLVTVYMRRGAIEVKSVARALQAGSAGQSVKVKNEATGDLFQVTLIGPQTAVISGSDPMADISN